MTECIIARTTWLPSRLDCFLAPSKRCRARSLWRSSASSKRWRAGTKAAMRSSKRIARENVCNRRVKETRRASSSNADFWERFRTALCAGAVQNGLHQGASAHLDPGRVARTHHNAQLVWQLVCRQCGGQSWGKRNGTGRPGQGVQQHHQPCGAHPESCTRENPKSSRHEYPRHAVHPRETITRTVPNEDLLGGWVVVRQEELASAARSSAPGPKPGQEKKNHHKESGPNDGTWKSR